MIDIEIIDSEVYLPCFKHLLDDDKTIDIELLWGGRDGAKSYTVAELFTEYSMSKEYFRALLIKETHESIKDAQWQTIKDVCENWYVDPLFHFTESPLSIRCVNGNKYLTRGMDNPAKIKSISNPSHAWIEEGNQISEQSFITILTSLRSMFGDIKLYMTFNPESTTPDYTEFWLYKMFFAKYEPQKNFTGEVVIKIGEETIKLRYRSTHTTYHDNPYVTAQRRAIHESLKETNYYWYKVYTLGEWGNPENDSPWAYSFDRLKHVSEPARGIPHPQLNRMYPVILSWDFNRNPMCCLVIQHYDNHVRVLEAIKMYKAGPEIICEYIKVNYPGCVYVVTGDYSGETKTSLFQEQITHYSIIQQSLNISDTQIRIKPNPLLAKNSTHVNMIFAYYKITMHAEKAKGLIFDCENVKRRADGTIVKDDRNDPAQQADCFVGETLISTISGSVAISDIKIGDQVLTHKGYRPVIDRWSSVAEVYEFEFTDGTKITCTKDHKFYNKEKGFVAIFDIFEKQLNVCKLKSFTTESDIKNISIKNIFTAHNHYLKQKIFIQGVCIVKSGLMLMGKFLKATRCITKMAMLLITSSPITNSKKNQNIAGIIQEKRLKKIPNSLLNFKKRVLQLLPNGTGLKKELNGTDKMRSNVISVIRAMDLKSVRYAIKSLRLKEAEQNFVQITASRLGEEKINQTKKLLHVHHAENNLKHSNTYQQNIVPKNVSLLPIHTAEKVKKVTYKGSQIVYDITVDKDYEFYANNILVLNCLDTFRYFCNQFLEDYKPMGFEIIDKSRKKEKKYSIVTEATDITEQLTEFGSVRQDAIIAIERGNQVICSKEEYYEFVRTAILKQAGWWLDNNDHVHPQLALAEIKRLDHQFDTEIIKVER